MTGCCGGGKAEVSNQCAPQRCWWAPAMRPARGHRQQGHVRAAAVLRRVDGIDQPERLRLPGQRVHAHPGGAEASDREAVELGVALGWVAVTRPSWTRVGWSRSMTSPAGRGGCVSTAY